MRRLTAVALCAIVLAAPHVAAAAAGDLDPGFDGDGAAVTPVEGTQLGAGAAVVYQPDGKLVVVGFAVSFSPIRNAVVLVRYLADGALDPGFGTGGIVTTPLPGTGDARALILQPDGTLVVGGGKGSGSTGGFTLLRYLPDGTLDPTFGSAGIVLTPFGTIGVDTGTTLVRQPDGKLVLGGWTDRFSGTRADFALARYRDDGSLDPTFGSGGLVVTPVGGAFAFDEMAALVLQPDGKLVAAGRTAAGTNADFALVRYQANGALDASFGAGGIVTTSFGSSRDQAFALALEPGGRIVAGGSATIDGHPRFALARYDAGGALDPTFGAGGRVIADTGVTTDEVIAALALEPGGKIVAAGRSDLRGVLARFHADGSLDATFGAGGSVRTSVLPNLTVFQGLVREPTGRLVVSGVTSDGIDFAPSSITVARYLGGDPCGDGLLGPCCPPSPRPGCRRQTAARRGRLVVRAATARRPAQLAWRWLKGAATAPADAGDPVGGDSDHLLCIYDESTGYPARLLELKAPAGGTCDGKPCWRAVDGVDLVYRDPEGSPDGLELVRVHAADAGRAEVVARARGGRVASLAFPLPLPLRVQLQADGAACWESTFSATGLKRSNGGALSAVGD